MEFSIAKGVLALLLVLAAVFDWRHRRIPNWLCAVGLAAGLLWQAFGTAGAGLFSPLSPGTLGLLQGLGGAAVLLLLGFVAWKFKLLGGGDGKLLAAVGAFVGLNAALKVFLATLVAGGLLAIAFVLFRRFRKFLPGLEGGRPAHDRLPYAVAIALGTLVYGVLVMRGALGA